jgi:hypothetical protein
VKGTVSNDPGLGYGGVLGTRLAVRNKTALPVLLLIQTGCGF